jgi:hypothetical protein
MVVNNSGDCAFDARKLSDETASLLKKDDAEGNVVMLFLCSGTSRTNVVVASGLRGSAMVCVVKVGPM